MRKVELNMNELQKYQEIKKLVDNNGNKLRTSEILKLSVRQINRLIAIYKEKGKAGFVHGNRFKAPHNKLSADLPKKIINLYENKYKIKDKNITFNFSHFRDKLIEDEKINISYSSLYKILMNHEIMSPKIHKATKRRLIKQQLIKSKQLKNLNSQEVEDVIDNVIALEDAHPRKERKKYFGELIER